MSQTTPPPEATTPPPEHQPRLLRRSYDDRWLGGVAAGFARYLGVDPVLVRVGLVVLLIVMPWELIALLYLACVVIVPLKGHVEPWKRPFVDRHGKALAVVAGVALLIGFAASFDDGWHGTHAPFGLFVVAVVLGAAWLIRKNSKDKTSRPPGSGPPQTPPTPGTPAPGSADPAAQYPTEQYTHEQYTYGPYTYGPYTSGPQASGPYVAPPFVTPPFVTTQYPAAAASGSGRPETAADVPPTPYPTEAYAAAPGAVPETTWRPRERSALGPLTVGAALVTAGSLVALDRADALSVPTVVVLASALVVVGLGLLVGAVLGRSRGLIVLGVVLSIVTGIAGAVHLPASNSVGDQVWRPLAVTDVAPSYEWGLGEAELDLTAVSSPVPVRTSVDLGVGQLRVIVPRNATVRLHAEVGIGAIDVVAPDGTLSANSDGWNRELTTTVAPSSPSPGATTFDLDLSVGVGHVEVTRA